MPFPQVPRPAHILIVDDDETNRIVARKLCGLFGATADVVERGEDSIVMCAACAYDLVLMDVRMPGRTASRRRTPSVGFQVLPRRYRSLR